MSAVTGAYGISFTSHIWQRGLTWAQWEAGAKGSWGYAIRVDPVALQAWRAANVAVEVRAAPKARADEQAELKLGKRQKGRDAYGER